MELKIVNVFNESEPEDEYVWIKVLEDTNLNNFIVCDNTYYPNGQASNKYRHYFKFPNFPVKKGNYVALYTDLNGRDASGTLSETKAKVYRFDWKLDKCVWNDTGDTAHLIKVAGHEAFKVLPVKK